MIDEVRSFIPWLRRLAEKGGKGVVNNVDARCLGRVADALATIATLTKERDEAKASEGRWFQCHLAHRMACDALGKANGQLLLNTAQERNREDRAESELSRLRETNTILQQRLDKLTPP